MKKNNSTIVEPQSSSLQHTVTNSNVTAPFSQTSVGAVSSTPSMEHQVSNVEQLGVNTACLIATWIDAGRGSEMVLIKSVTHLVEYANYVTSPEGKINLSDRDFKLRSAKPCMSDFWNKPYMCAFCGEIFGHGKLQQLETHVLAAHRFLKRNSYMKRNVEATRESQGAAKDMVGLDGGKHSSKNKDLQKIESREQNSGDDASKHTSSNVENGGSSKDLTNDKGLPASGHIKLPENSCGKDNDNKKSDSCKLLQISDKNTCKLSQNSDCNMESEATKQSTIFPEQRWPCDFCDNIFENLQQWGRHQHAMHKGRKYKCPDCGKEFPLGKKALLRIHMQKSVCQPKDQPRKTCTICGRKFNRLQGLQNHMKALHCEEFSENLKAICEICGKRFTSQKGVSYHIKIVHTDEKPFQCEVCGKKFKLKQYLEIHNRQHTGEKPFKCSYCDKRCATHAFRLIHERRHRSEKPYKCTMCPKAFVSGTMRNTHMDRHVGHKPHACSVCSSRFVTRSEVKTHEMTHTDIRPHKCSHCKLRFRMKINKVQHERVHTGEKPFKCTKCDSCFARSNWLKLHLAKKHDIHVPFHHHVRKSQPVSAVRSDSAPKEISETIEVEGMLVDTVMLGAEEFVTEASYATQTISKDISKETEQLSTVSNHNS